MGKTISEKILAKASGISEAVAGDYVQVAPRRPVTVGWRFERGPGQFESLGATKVYNPELVNVVNGHFGVTASHRVAEYSGRIKQWCGKMGIPPHHVFDLGRQGVEHILSMERCWALPGEVFVEIVNGHTSALGALGAFAFTLSYESGAFLVTGKTWVQIPETARFNITGSLQKGVTPRDVFESILGQVGEAGAAGQVMEWTGPAIESMGIDGRFTLCSGAIFMGAWTGIVNPDLKTLEYVRARTNEPFEPLFSDCDANYANGFEFDVSEIAPQVVPPPRRDGAKPVSDISGVAVNKGFIGSCFNGCLDDMRVAGEVLKGKKLHPNVVLNITPGTVEIYKQCLREGLIETFVEAEAVVAAPACGMCNGSNTPLADGDVCVSTGTSNHPGRMGSSKAEIYLGSPATVAASCIEGKIADPRNYL